MKLMGFQVKGFRSVIDSGWIDADSVTALIGTNESGKTNLLVPLWKLNPAKDGGINPIADYPRKRYNEIRAMTEKPNFIRARFALSPEQVDRVASMTRSAAEEVSDVDISRDFDGKYSVEFPRAKSDRTMATADVRRLLEAARVEIATALPAAESDIIIHIQGVESALPNRDLVNQVEVEVVHKALIAHKGLDEAKLPVPSKCFRRLVQQVAEVLTSLGHPNENTAVRDAIIAEMPRFVYYSNYGNLDSEIYLPHVLANMKRENLGPKEEAKARTLRVLFQYVRLKPEEIMELGKDPHQAQGNANETQIRQVAEKKKERDILLQSAGTDLTGKFRDWWKQGEYRFRFQADGDHFRIWVSDDRRPEDIELESRSTGLQWFLSFYLVFLVESTVSHQNAILLLDEPGLSLHPLAQRDLGQFFENLSRTNQLIYTTHSPFLVDSDHLDRVKAVYVDQNGATCVSANLRAAEGRPAESKSIYPVHAALGLSVSDALMQGCQPIIVEGPSDQMIMVAIRNYLIGHGLIAPPRDLIFLPAGGCRGVSAVVPIVAGRDEEMPFVLVDGDTNGLALAKSLKDGLYSGYKDRVVVISAFTGIDSSEVEDLWDQSFMQKAVDQFLRGAQEEEFTDVYIAGKPVIPQIESYARKHSLTLERGWKVDLARRAKQRLAKNKTLIPSESPAVARWVTLFKLLIG